MKFKFMELEYHVKLEFPKIEYPKSRRSLHISDRNNGRLIYILVNNAIVPFWPLILVQRQWHLQGVFVYLIFFFFFLSQCIFNFF